MVQLSKHPTPSQWVSLVPLPGLFPLVAFPEVEMKLLDGPSIQPSLTCQRGRKRGWSRGDACAKPSDEAGAPHPSHMSLRGWSPMSY